MRRAGFKKTVAAMLAALMVVNTMDSVLPGSTAQAIQHTQEMVIQDEEKQKPKEKEVTELTPSVPEEQEAEVLEPEVNAYSQGAGHFTVTLNGSGHTVSYMIYLYNVKNLEPAVGGTVSITKIGSKDTPSATEPQWKVVRLDNNGSDAKAYFDLSFEELILRRDGPTSYSQGWSGAQVKIKFNMDKHVYQISQEVEKNTVENGRLCLISSSDPKDMSLVSQMKEENNTEADESCENINNKLNEHNGATGITGYLQCNSYNCGLADFNEDGNYSFGELTINFNKGKETLKINPNHGTYTKNNGETITGTKAEKLTTKTCGETTAINTPKRNGYTFDGWTVTHGTGGNGSYNTSTKKYTHCTTAGTGTTTLKATWKKVGATNTPTPTLKPTATPIPKYKATVNYYKCPYNDTTTGTIFETTPNKGEYASGTNVPLYINSKCPIGYFYWGIHNVTENRTSYPKDTGTEDTSFKLSKNTEVNVIFMPNQSTLQVDPNGGTWNGSTEVQSFTQGYGTTLEIPEPERERDKYKFGGWKQQITNGSMSDDNTTYKFGPNAGVTDYITAQWKAFGFTIKYARNEPSGIEKLPMQPQVELNIESQDSIYDVGSYENAKFIGWCLAIGNWNENTGELTSVRWLKADGTFDGTEKEKDEKRFDTDGYTGKVFQNLASVQEFVPYVDNDGEVLTLVGMWTIDVDYDAEDGTNTAALTAGQHGIAPDKTFALVNEAPSLMGNEFVQWIDSIQQTMNNAGKSFAETGKMMSMLAMENRLAINGENTRQFNKGGIVNWGFGKDTILYATYRYYIQYQKADGSIIKNGKYDKFDKMYDSNTIISDVVYPTDGNTEGHHYTSEKLWQVTADNSERYKYADASNYSGKNYSNSYKQGVTAMVNRSVILKAAEEANIYTIKYVANNNVASTKHLQDWNKMTDQKIAYGESMTLKDIAGSELPGYTFAGWNTKSDGTGVNFSDKESNTVKQFLNKAEADVNENGAVIHLYAQWKAKSYTITFDVNRPSTSNNTHASSNAPVLNGAATMEYVWDNVITNNRIEYLNIPLATLKGWHQRFSDSLWYTGNTYNVPGTAIKDGTKLGYETLGAPGNKVFYAQWEANTYTIEYDGNGVQSGGRGRVQGIVEPQTLTYDKAEKLKENAYKKHDETYQYHDDEKIPENSYNTKHNEKAVDSFKYYWLGWCRKRVTEGKDEEPDKSEIISQADIEAEEVWNFTDIDKGRIVLYAFWDGIPNITTKSEETHFDRYQGAHLSGTDMKKLVKTYDLEEGEELEIKIKNISYYVNGSRTESVDFPKDNYMLDTTLPKTMWEDGKYKTYSITFETVDKHQVKNYMGEQSQKEAVYFGKIYYNNEPVIEPCNEDGIFHERYLYLQEIKEMDEKELETVLSRHIRMGDKEDTEYEKDRQNDLYLGRWYEEAKIEIVQLSDIWKKATNQEENWNLQEKAEGKTLEYIVRYTDIFGKRVTKNNKLHIIDSEHDSCGENDKRKQSVRFISKEYLDTLEKDSQWYQRQENRKALENILNNAEISEEIYELQKGK